MMRRVPVKAIYLKRNESYGIDNKLIKYKDLYAEDAVFNLGANKDKLSLITIDSNVEERRIPALDDDSKDSLANELLEETQGKSILDTYSTKTKVIPDDKSSHSASSRVENSYKNFKNKINLMKQRSSSILKRIKIGFLASLLFNIMLYSIIFAFLQSSATEYSSNTDTLSTLGDLRYDMINVAYLTKKLQEIDSGYTLSESREEIIEKLKVISEDIKTYANDLQSTSLKGSLIDTIRFKKFLWWFNEDGKFTEGKLNIIDSSKHVNILINSIISEEFLSIYPYFLEIYRNTPSEMNSCLNSTSVLFKEEYKIYTENHMDEIMIIFNALVNAKFLTKIILILYVFTLINSIRKRIFISLLDRNKVNLSIALVKIKDRLIFIHNDDNSTIEIDDKAKIKSRLTYGQHRYQKIVYVLIGIVASLMTFIIIFPNILTTPNLIKILGKEVSYIYLNTELRTLILHAFFTARYSGVPVSVNLSNQYFADGNEELKDYLKQIDYTSKLAFESVDISDDIENTYIDSDSIGTCLNTGIYEYSFLLRDIPYLSDGVSIINYLETHEDYMQNLITSLKDIENHIKDDSDTSMTQELNKIFEIIMLMISIQGLVLVTGFFPLLTKFQKVLNDEIEILLYLPREESNPVNIKSRR